MTIEPDSQFHLFNGLPSELRLKIFGFAAFHEGRIIELERPNTFESFVNQEFDDTLLPYVRVCQQSKKALALLHACYLSRVEALMHYMLMIFSTKVNTPIYFN